jgi:hypothetical protein
MKKTVMEAAPLQLAEVGRPLRHNGQAYSASMS